MGEVILFIKDEKEGKECYTGSYDLDFPPRVGEEIMYDSYGEVTLTVYKVSHDLHCNRICVYTKKKEDGDKK